MTGGRVGGVGTSMAPGAARTPRQGTGSLRRLLVLKAPGAPCGHVYEWLPHLPQVPRGRSETCSAWCPQGWHTGINHIGYPAALCWKSWQIL